MKSSSDLPEVSSGILSEIHTGISLGILLEIPLSVLPEIRPVIFQRMLKRFSPGFPGNT